MVCGRNWHLCTSVNCIIDWIDHWQTLLAGLGAVVAAGISIHYLRQQIASTEAQERRRRARRLAAARARLPLSLSDATHYADEALALLKRCLDSIGPDDELAENIAASRRPTLPEATIQSFEAIIEATDDDLFAAFVASMISEMQVLDSRLGGLLPDRQSLGRLSIQAYILTAAKVYGYASSAFDYARRETEDPPHLLDWDAVISALNLNEMYREAYPELHTFVGRARDRAAPLLSA